jgi:arginine N-succinyltransferase
MLRVRMVQGSDLDAIYHLASQSGVGLTTFPKERPLLEKRLQTAIHSFQKQITSPGNEYYLFVLEDVDKSQIVGTSAITASTGYETPFYSYKLSDHSPLCASLKQRNHYQLLNLVNDYEHCSELCTLFIAPKYRGNHNSLLLSKARFLFMANEPRRFEEKVIAEMRGVSDEHGRSPFWDNLGQHFFKISFEEADNLTLASDKQYIADLMPTHPIYVPLLSAEAQAIIGQAHQKTIPAMNILEKEGFLYQNYVDIFDAGPTVEALRSSIRTIAQSRLLPLSGFCKPNQNQHYLIANTKAPFRTVMQDLEITGNDSCRISEECARLLEVSVGETLRVSSIV